MRFLRSLVAIAPLALLACGGKVEVVAGGSGGHAATGSTTGEGGGGSGACPENQPTDGAPCHVGAETTCSYGECCPDLYLCVDGKWQDNPAYCPVAMCPTTLPVAGSACPCQAGLFCSDYADVNTSATCDGAVWSVTCGGQACSANELCVHTVGGSHCAPNDCGATPSCDCTKACGDLACASVAGAEVFCVAP